MLNVATIAAIVAAVWAHPSGVSYLEKIQKLYTCNTPNPCCVSGGGYSYGTPIGFLQSYKDLAGSPESISHITEMRDEDDLILQMIIAAVTQEMI